MSPQAQFVKDILTAVDKARDANMPPEKIVQYLRDLAQDVAETATH